MRNHKKTMLAAMAAVVLLGATPAFAQLNGYWEGEGYGECKNPVTGDVMFPWQYWGGTITNFTDFEGSWKDIEGNRGHFYGCLFSSSQWGAEFYGEWYLSDEENGIDELMGDFVMDFVYSNWTCKGEWQCYSTNEHGWMRGKKIY